MYRVLIADGDRQSRELLMAALSGDDCRIEGVESGAEALRRVVQGDVDVLIAEVHLPDMPAWTLFSRLHRDNPGIPTIAVTADDSWETSRRVRTEGGPVFFYGLKPLNLREMRQVVRSAAQWRQKCRRSEAPSAAMPDKPPKTGLNSEMRHGSNRGNTIRHSEQSEESQHL